MKTLIFGSTGKTGRELVKQALEQGLEILAFARTPEKLNDLKHPNLIVLKGDVTNYESVEQAVKKAEVVISALGSPTLKKNTIVSDGTKNIIKAMNKFGIKRFICITALGAGKSHGEPGFFFTYILVPLLIKNVMADIEIQEKYIMESSLDWTIIRPVGLTNGKKRGVYKHGEKIKNLTLRISRADVANFMLKQIESKEYIQKTPAICY